MRLLVFLVITSFLSCNSKHTFTPVEIKLIADYPSASTIEYINGILYVMGDDATSILALDTNLNKIDSFALIDYPDKRIPKNIKPDLESSIYFQDTLFFFGSGSLPPHRNIGWSYTFKSKSKNSVTLTALYNRIITSGIKQLNIEGACIIDSTLILTNRGNKSYPVNSFVLTSKYFIDGNNSRIKIIPISTQTDTSSFAGISGICYSAKHDKLIMTVSTEDTRSSFEDGTIGNSFLWIINKAISKLANATISPNRIIDLTKIDKRFSGQKIESGIIIEEDNEKIRLVLVADNDNGSSTVFKLTISAD